MNHDESTASSLIDVDSPHVSSVKSDFQSQEIKTETQADRIAREAEESAERARLKASREASAAKDKASAEAKKAKAEAKKAGKKLQDNKDNPVVIGNAILWGVTAAAVGYGAYQKQQEGKLDWKLAGTVGAGLAALAAGDYFASQYVICEDRCSACCLFANLMLLGGCSRTSTLPSRSTEGTDLHSRKTELLGRSFKLSTHLTRFPMDHRALLEWRNIGACDGSSSPAWTEYLICASLRKSIDSGRKCRFISTFCSFRYHYQGGKAIGKSNVCIETWKGLPVPVRSSDFAGVDGVPFSIPNGPHIELSLSVITNSCPGKLSRHSDPSGC
jgi:hypothetical protein